MSIHIEPADGVVLVKLSTSEFGDIPVPEKAHDSMTHGIIVAVSRDNSILQEHIGKLAFWRKFKDDARIPGKEKLVLIEVKDILGYGTDSSSSN